MSLGADELDRLKFANILREILGDFLEDGLWPERRSGS
jgi:hypothetical protein